MSDCRTIAVANQKGGVAKTTTVASLGAALVEAGVPTLAVDLDPQACLTFSLGFDPDSIELSVHDVLLGRISAGMAVRQAQDGLALLPATIDLAGTEAALLTRPGREFILRAALSEVAASYGVILLDCAPSLGVLTLGALTAADDVLIPMQCETLSHRGVGQLLDTVHDVQRLTNPGLRVMGVLPTLFDARTSHARAVLSDVAGRYDLTVLEPPIAKSVRFAEAPAAGRSILHTAARTPGAQAYRVHARRIAGLPVEPDPEPGSGALPAADPATADPAAADPAAAHTNTGTEGASRRAEGETGDTADGDRQIDVAGRVIDVDDSAPVA